MSRHTDLAWYMDLYNKAKVTQDPLHNEMRDNLRFIDTDQWYGVQHDKRASTPTMNLLFSNIEQEVAMLSLQHPSFSINPAATDDNDSATALDIIMRIQMNRIKLAAKQEHVIRNMLRLGTGIIKTYWDNMTPYFLDGDINIAVVSPLNFLIDPNAPDMENAEYCFYRVFRSAEYIEGRYGYTMPSGTDPVKNTEVIAPTDMSGEGFWVVECFMRPSWSDGKRQDKGTYCVFLENDANHWLVSPEDSPVPYGDLPFIAIPNIRTNESIWGMSEIKQTKEIQIRLNKQWGFITDQIRLGNMTKYVSDDPKRKNSTCSMNPNEELHLTPGSKMQLLQPRGIDLPMLNLVGMLESNIRNVSGIHDVSSGAAGNVQAASAIQSLASLGSQRMTVRQQHMAYGMQDMALQLIALMAQQYKRDRYFRIGSKEVKDFNGTQILPYYDVTANYEEGEGGDRMTLFNMALQVAQLPPDVQATVTKILNTPRLTQMVNDRNAELKALADKAAENPPPDGSTGDAGTGNGQGTPSGQAIPADTTGASQEQSDAQPGATLPPLPTPVQ